MPRVEKPSCSLQRWDGAMRRASLWGPQPISPGPWTCWEEAAAPSDSRSPGRNTAQSTLARCLSKGSWILLGMPPSLGKSFLLALPYVK